MDTEATSYSPNILIYLEIGKEKIRLADVFHETATLYKPAEVSPGTSASLILSIDGKIERHQIVLDEGITKENELISFSYSHPDSDSSITPSLRQRFGLVIRRILAPILSRISHRACPESVCPF